MNKAQPTKEPTPPPGSNNSYQFKPIQHQPPTLSFISKATAVEAGKITATSTHFELDQQPNCVSSLINMSCRGRAEAFARSLQSRLKTLGSQGEHQEVDTVDSSDSSWLSNANNNIITAPQTITDLQPRPTMITTESADAYFDFDMEPESPGSPIDECEYTRLIETSVSTPNEQQAPESGFVCASPCSTHEGESRGSASSSDAQFFDPESSDTGTEFFDCAEPKPPRRYMHLNHNRVAVRPPSPIAASPSSSESSATPQMNGHVRLLETGCDSSDSFPPSQSTGSSISTASKLNSKSNSNSTLQDAEGEIEGDEESGEDVEKPVEVAEKKEEVSEVSEEPEDEKFTASHYKVAKTLFVKYTDEDDEEEKFDQEKVLAEITTVEEEPEPKEETPAPPEPKRESDEESEYHPTPRIRRCSSLKTGKTPPGTPGRSKSVRFADVLGLDLADVRTFLDEVPKIPKSAYEDLDVTLPPQTLQLGPQLEKVLVPLFQQPGSLPNFIDRLRDSQVCLENAAVIDPISLTITGCVRVRNLDFHKSVHIRYSMDGWRSYSDLTASYVENSCDGFSDKFSFILFGNSLQIGQRVELAIRFQAKGEQFWDSNYGTNYCFQCLPCSGRTPMLSELHLTPDESLSTANQSSSSITTHTDAMGSRQWSNTFLY